MSILLPSFSIDEIPFSFKGSWLDLSPVVGLHRRASDVHLVSHVNGMNAVVQLTPVVGGTRAETTTTATPASLTWRAPSGTGSTGSAGVVEAAFESTDTLRVRGTGLDMDLMSPNESLTPFSGIYFYAEPSGNAFVFTSYNSGRRYRISVLSGVAEAVGDQLVGSGDRGVRMSGAEWEVAIEEYETARTPYSSRTMFDDVARLRGESFAAYVDQVCGWRSESSPAAAIATYVLWSATVDPAGYIARPSVLMSKHWMDKVWSWDHAFNAIALAPGDPELAWHQLNAPFDHVDASGAMPDSVTHSEILFNFVKPPIHGWALRLVRERLATPLTSLQLNDFYDRLARWTRFWLDFRRAEGSVVPHYQHGNDSGWDNATTFDAARLIEAPDLAAFLVIQLDVLAELSAELGRGEESAWSVERDAMRAALDSELWDGERFASRGLGPVAGVGELVPTLSLLDLMPIALGADLTAEQAAATASALEKHLTKFGLATERPDSTYYEPDGYWRGPIWAPSTMLIENGLRRAGFIELADSVRERFLRLCEKSGFAENFDALTGEGLRDRAYTWTASVYLTLAYEAIQGEASRSVDA